MSKSYTEQIQDWEAEQESLKEVSGSGSGTVHKHEVRVADYALNLLKLENEAMTQRLKSAREGMGT